MANLQDDTLDELNDSFAALMLANDCLKATTREQSELMDVRRAECESASPSTPRHTEQDTTAPRADSAESNQLAEQARALREYHEQQMAFIRELMKQHERHEPEVQDYYLDLESTIGMDDPDAWRRDICKYVQAESDDYFGDAVQ